MNTNPNHRRSDGRAYFSRAYFRGELRRAWPKTLCYTIFLFFVLPLPILFQVNSRRSWEYADLAESLSVMLGRNVWIYTLATAAVAVFAGMLAMHYLTHRASVDYYHSLPVRREGLFAMQWLAGACEFVLALAVDLLLSVVILATVEKWMSTFTVPLGVLFTAAGYMLLAFLLFYTLTVFCGMLCGTSVMQVMVTGLSLGAFPLFRLLYLAFAETVVSNIDIDYFIDQQPWGWTSPLLRLVSLSDGRTDRDLSPARYVLESPLTLWEIALWILASAALFLGAVALYRRRHVERAGMPVVFGGVAAAVKWAVILLGTMAMGWLFLELGGGIFWMYFGFLLGGFLAFLLINAILAKNPKQMFEGWRRLLIYLAVFCLTVTGLGYATATVEDIIPKKIERIAITLGGDAHNVPYYTDPAVIEEWQKLWAKEPTDNPYRVMQDEFYAGFDEFVHEEGVRTFYFGNRTSDITAYVDVGLLVIPYARRSYIGEDAEALLRAMADSDEFEAGWDAMMSEVASGHYTTDAPEAEWTAEDADWGGPIGDVQLWELFRAVYDGSAEKRYITANTVRMLVGEMPEDIDFEFFQSPVYAQVNAANLARLMVPKMGGSAFSTNWFPLSVTANMPALYRETLGMDEERFWGTLADSVLETHGGLYVARHLRYEFTPNSEGVMYVTDRGQIIEILRGLSMLDTKGASRRFSEFTVVEEDYAVAFPRSGSDQVVYFIKGKVPAFVTAALGS